MLKEFYFFWGGGGNPFIIVLKTTVHSILQTTKYRFLF